MNSKNLYALLVALFVAAALAACGGGGDGGTPPPPATYSISGTVTLSGGSGLSGVSVSLNSSTTVTTDSSGNFTFSGLANGVYTIAPALAGYTFNPVNLVITISGATVSSVNFTATAALTTYSLVGRVTITGTTTGLQGVTMTLNTLATTNTDTNGDYAFTLLSNGSYTVTPSHSNYTFTPESKNQTISGGDATGVDFIATPIPDPTKAIVKFSTSPTVTLIGAIDIVVALPVGASLKTSGTTSTVDPASAYKSGNGASSELFIATYSAASMTLHAMLGSTTGFASGEFMTIEADLTGGVKPTASDFLVNSLAVYGVDTQPLGLTATTSVTLRGGGAPTKGRLKLVTSGTTTTITGVDVTIKLPTGVSVASTQSPPATDPGVVFASGNAISNSLVAGNYDPVNQTLHIGLINLYGFDAGEFATVMCNLSGVTPVSTDFQIQSATLYGLYSSTSVTGSVDRTVTLE